jgi:GxxExxY protein
MNDNLTGRIIGAAIEVHRVVGPGLLESIYEECLARELEMGGLRFERQRPIPIEYKGQRVAVDLKVDLWVEHQVIVELKAVEKLLPIHEAQLLTYLRLTNTSVGLLINFHVPALKDGVKRMVNHFHEKLCVSASLR